MSHFEMEHHGIVNNIGSSIDTFNLVLIKHKEDLWFVEDEDYLTMLAKHFTTYKHWMTNRITPHTTFGIQMKLKFK
jgi:hypothetical protein